MQWIKCSEQMPEENMKVLIFISAAESCDAGIMLADYMNTEVGPVWFCNCHETDALFPTHWMSLPSFPGSKYEVLG